MLFCWTTMLAQQESAKIIGQENIKIGETIILKVKFEPVDTLVVVTWQSSNPEIAIINQKEGTITGVEAGKIIITAIVPDELPAPPQFEIEVIEPEKPVEQSGASDGNSEEKEKGDSIHASNAGAGGTGAGTGSGVSSTPVAEPVTIDVTSMNLEKKELTLGCDPKILTYTIKPDNATNKTTVTWKSLYGKVKVEKGVVTPIAAGIDTIVISTNNNKTDTCFVTVLDVEGSVKEIQALNSTIQKLNNDIGEKIGRIEDLEFIAKNLTFYKIITLSCIAIAIVFFILLLFYSQKLKRKKEQPEDGLVKLQQELAKKQDELEKAQVEFENAIKLLKKDRDDWKDKYELEQKYNNRQAGITTNENRYQNPPKYENAITKEEVRPKPSNRLFADFIDADEFRNIAEVPSAMTNFVLVLSASGTTATFKVYEEAISRVMDRPNYLAGCIKDITPDGTNFSQTEGKAHKQGDKWIVDDNNRLKVIIS